MVQPIVTSLGRNAKILSSGNRVISETFKDNKGITTVVTRVLNKDNDVVLTRMKRIFQNVLKSGKKIFTRQDETHFQEILAGTNTLKQGKENVYKVFSIKEKAVSDEGNLILNSKLVYKKNHNSDYNFDKIKTLDNGKLSSITYFDTNKDVKSAIRRTKHYSGSDVDKLQHKTLFYNVYGVPTASNKFDLSEFEIYNV